MDLQRAINQVEATPDRRGFFFFAALSRGGNAHLPWRPQAAFWKRPAGGAGRPPMAFERRLGVQGAQPSLWKCKKTQKTINFPRKICKSKKKPSGRLSFGWLFPEKLCFLRYKNAKFAKICLELGTILPEANAIFWIKRKKYNVCARKGKSVTWKNVHVCYYDIAL